MPEEIISIRVGEIRKERGLSQEELAQKVDVSRQTINALEKGNYFPSLLLALKIAQTFDTTVDSIFSLKEE